MNLKKFLYVIDIMMFISASISSNLYKLYLKSVIDVPINNLINSLTNNGNLHDQYSS